MHILFVYQYFSTPEGSWSTRVYDFAQDWIAQGHSVEVISSPYPKSDIKPKGKFLSSLVVEGIQLHLIPLGDHSFSNKFIRGIRALFFALTASFLLVRKKYDLIICSSGPITVGIPLIWSKLLFPKRKVVFEVRDLWPGGGIELGIIRNKLLATVLKKFEKLIYSRSDTIVAASKGIYDHLCSYNLQQKLTVVNHPCVQLNNHNYPLPSGYAETLKNKKIVLYAGSLGRMDDCETLVDTMRTYTQQPLALVIVGTGVEHQKIKDKVTQLKLQNVHVLGLLKRAEVFKWYALADLSFIGFKNLPVLATSSPNKLYDSLAFGVPIVQNTQGWMAQLVADYNIGFTVEHNSQTQLKKVFDLLLANDPRLHQMRENALNLAKTKFSLSTLSAKYLKAIINS